MKMKARYSELFRLTLDFEISPHRIDPDFADDFARTIEDDWDEGYSEEENFSAWRDFWLAQGRLQDLLYSDLGLKEDLFGAVAQLELGLESADGPAEDRFTRVIDGAISRMSPMDQRTLRHDGLSPLYFDRFAELRSCLAVKFLPRKPARMG